MNRQWRLRRRPHGQVAPGDLELVESPMPVCGAGEALVRNIYLSIDPTNRIWMSDIDQYMPPVAVGEVMRGGTIGVVEASNTAGLCVGDIVMPAVMGWQDYVVTPMARKLAISTQVPILAHMSVLGLTGMTAYFGLLDIGRPRPGETVVVSAAAGAVGSVVGQIARIKDCRVVGLAGSDDKCRWVVEDLGFDACVNYRREDVGQALRRHCPRGIDIYFENVGGAILDAVLVQINLFARIPLCGLISTYNSSDPVPGPYMFRNILMKRALLRGFIVADYFPRAEEFHREMLDWVVSGKVKWRVDVEQGLENAPAALHRLFAGGNIGKMVVQVGPEPQEPADPSKNNQKQTVTPRTKLAYRRLSSGALKDGRQSGK